MLMTTPKITFALLQDIPNASLNAEGGNPRAAALS